MGSCLHTQEGLYIREGDIKNPYIDNVLQYSERKDKRVRDNPSRIITVNYPRPPCIVWK
jgi:hypothetical protein